MGLSLRSGGESTQAQESCSQSVSSSANLSYTLEFIPLGMGYSRLPESTVLLAPTGLHLAKTCLSHYSVIQLSCLGKLASLGDI